MPSEAIDFEGVTGGDKELECQIFAHTGRLPGAFIYAVLSGSQIKMVRDVDGVQCHVCRASNEGSGQLVNQRFGQRRVGQWNRLWQTVELWSTSKQPVAGFLGQAMSSLPSMSAPFSLSFSEPYLRQPNNGLNLRKREFR